MADEFEDLLIRRFPLNVGSKTAAAELDRALRSHQHHWNKMQIDKFKKYLIDQKGVEKFKDMYGWWYRNISIDHRI